MSDLRESEKKSASRHTWLFLLEITFAIALFAVAASVMLGVFTTAAKKQDTAECMHVSNVELQNVVEIVRGSDSFLELNSNLNMNYELDKDISESNVTVVDLKDDYKIELSCLDHTGQLYYFQAKLLKDDMEIDVVNIDHYMRGGAYEK
ncbi:MAG: hypothetical protein K6B67_04205 [Lachnospiraceae bacterium]|nr:hypothetical protein [Lachnospiraceae bacterium]